MEKKASFRECPKCGLRNKATAVQCDFCGQSLTIGDDWQSHVKDLESLTKMDLRKPMDDKVSKRIESTIIRKETNQHKGIEIKEVGSLENILRDLDQTQPLKEIRIEEKKQRPDRAEEPEREEEPEPEVQTSEPVEPEAVKETEPQGPVVSEEQGPAQEADVPGPEEVPPTEPELLRDDEATIITEAEDVIAEPEDQVLPDSEPSEMEGAMVEEPLIIVSTDSSASTIKLKLVQVEEAKRPLDEDTVAPTMHRTKLMVTRGMALAILGVGIVLYLVFLALVAVDALDTVPGLGMGAVASVVTIYGASATYRSLRGKDPEEVFICPKCHETVDNCKQTCPACGASFRSED